MRPIDADVLEPKFIHGRWDDTYVSNTELMNAPTVDAVERKRGRWEMKPDPYGFFEVIPVCSECGCTTKMRETYKYCPHCGAEMREGEEE